MHHTGLQAQRPPCCMECPIRCRIRPCMDDPPMYHSLRRESVKSTDSGSVTGVKSIRSTWFQDTTATRGPPPSSGQGTPEPMHGLRLMIKEEALIISDQPFFPAVTELAKRGLLSPETWQCNRPRVSLKTSIDVPMLNKMVMGSSKSHICQLDGPYT